MHANMSNYQSVLFDLDGTLVDSRQDLSHSIQLMLSDLRLRNIESDEILTFVGEGARLLVERSLRAAMVAEPEDALVDQALKVFKEKYSHHLLDSTRPYPEVEETLNELQFTGVTLGVVTNKPHEFSTYLLDGLRLLDHFSVVIGGGESLNQRKPSPFPLLEAARRCASAPQDCLMVGDTRIDITAGRDAGMATCGFTGGFRGRSELIAAGADFLIDRFSQLKEIIFSPEKRIGRRASSDI